MALKTTDEQIAEMCAWLKANNMIAQTTLAGKLTLTPKEDLIYEQFKSAARTDRGF
jgi:hypothetical protein